MLITRNDKSNSQSSKQSSKQRYGSTLKITPLVGTLNIYEYDTGQFCKLDKDPTKTIETKVQRAIRKIKDHLSTSEYQTLYPSRLPPDKFYGIARKHNPSKWNCWWLFVTTNYLQHWNSFRSPSTIFSQNAVTIEQIRVHSQ